ncbi:flavin reductase family protein [Phytohabitans suffuscus]|uniref:flavin reductase family protein n=1 Tax=Phytohabitans suffuscus TaxID=624315 RepID=UPI001566F6C0|nr:flavin reductase family protein [Phytohabitans suffuscus]
MLGRFVTGVTVVTARVAGSFLGLTANSFTSVSLEPPQVLFCVHSSSRARDGLQRAAGFAVNILGADQEQISRQFAATDSDRFTGVDVRPGRTGAPILTDAVAFLECRRVAEMTGGDHLIVLGEVLEFGVLSDRAPSRSSMAGMFGWAIPCPEQSVAHDRPVAPALADGSATSRACATGPPL